MSHSGWKPIALLMTGLWCSVSVMANEFEIGQNNKRFVMKGDKVEKLAIKVGDVVRFRNEDPFFHNIFSLSEIKLFDLGSFPKGDFRTVTFDKAGTAELECAIHPDMHMVIEVQ